MAIVSRQDLKDHLHKYPSSFDIDTTYLNKERVRTLITKLVTDRKNTTKADTEAVQISNFLSYLYFVLDDSDQALQHCEESLQHSSDNITANTNKANILLENGESVSDIEDIITKLKDLEKREDYNKLRCCADADLAYAYSRAGPWYHEKAVELYGRVVHACPSEYAWQFGLGITLLRQDHLFISRKDDKFNPDVKVVRLVKVSKLMLKVATDSSDTLLQGKAWAKLGQAVFNISKLHNPRNIPPDINELKNIECFARAIEKSPDEPYVLAICGQYARYRGHLATSEELLRKSLVIRPTLQTYHHLALTLKRKVDFCKPDYSRQDFDLNDNSSRMSVSDTLDNDNAHGMGQRMSRSAYHITGNRESHHEETYQRAASYQGRYHGEEHYHRETQLSGQFDSGMGCSYQEGPWGGQFDSGMGCSYQEGPWGGQFDSRMWNRHVDGRRPRYQRERGMGRGNDYWKQHHNQQGRGLGIGNEHLGSQHQQGGGRARGSFVDWRPSQHQLGRGEWSSNYYLRRPQHQHGRGQGRGKDYRGSQHQQGRGQGRGISERGRSHYPQRRGRDDWGRGHSRDNQKFGRTLQDESTNIRQLIKSPLTVSKYVGNALLIEAIDLLQEALKLDKYAVLMYYDIGIIYRMLDQQGEAVKIFKKILSMKKYLTAPTMLTNANEQLGLCLLEMSKLDTCSPEEKLKNEKDGKSHLYHAVELQSAIVANNQRLKGAWHSYPTLKELLENRNSNSPKELAILHVLMGDHSDALDVYRKIMKHHSDQMKPSDYTSMLQSYRETGQLDEAVFLLGILQCTVIFAEISPSLKVDVFIDGALHAYSTDNVALAYQRFRGAFRAYTELLPTQPDDDEDKHDILILHDCDAWKCKWRRGVGKMIHEYTGLRCTINGDDVLPGTTVTRGIVSTLRAVSFIIIVVSHSSKEQCDSPYIEHALQVSKDKSGPKILVMADDVNNVPDVVRPKPFVIFPPHVDSIVNPGKDVPEDHKEWLKEFVSSMKT